MKKRKARNFIIKLEDGFPIILIQHPDGDLEYLNWDDFPNLELHVREVINKKREKNERIKGIDNE